MNKRFTLLLCIVMIIGMFNSVLAQTSKTKQNVTMQVQEFVAPNIDTNELFNPSDFAQKNAYVVRTKPVEPLCFTSVKIGYNEQTMTLSFKANITQGGKRSKISASGTVYNRQHVNYDICYLVDLDVRQDKYTFVYFEMFNENSQDKLNIFIEDNTTGSMYNIITNIPHGMLNKINGTAFDNMMSEEQYMNLVTLNKKSPNHSFNKDNNFIQIDEPYETLLESDQAPIAPYSNKENVWSKLLKDQKYNTINSRNYAVDRGFFESLEPTPGLAQWRTYKPSNSFDYRMVRCAYYNPTSRTYAFYYSMVRPMRSRSGNHISFHFGFTDTPNTIHPQSYSYRVELNPNNRTLRYVADYGLKFKPTIHVKLNKSTFTVVTCGAVVEEVKNSHNIVKFALGLIPGGVGTGLSILDLILQYGSEVPKKSPKDPRIWTKPYGSGDMRDAVISFYGTSAYCYKPKDQVFLNAQHKNISSPVTVTYSWSYSVSS